MSPAKSLSLNPSKNSSNSVPLPYLRDPKDAVLFEQIANRLDHDDVLFGSLKWLENSKEMKQAAIDLLNNDYPKQWMVLYFNL